MHNFQTHEGHNQAYGHHAGGPDIEPEILAPQPGPGHSPNMLRPQPRASRLKGRTAIWIAAALIAAEIVAPAHLKPTELAGEAIGRIYSNIQEEQIPPQLTLEEQRYLAQMWAERKSEYGAWKGRCAMLALLDAQLAAGCRQAADAFYREALREVERERQRFLDRKR